MDVDNVIIAIGQEVDRAMLLSKLEYTDSGTLCVDPVTLQTNVEGVFAGGDMVALADIISAIADGKKAAISIDRYLRGVDLEEERPAPLQKVKEVPKEDVKTKTRSAMPVLRPEERKDFIEVELGFSENEAVGEAGRCLHCGCSDCLTCHQVCFYEVHSIGVQGHTEQKPENCDGCAYCIDPCPYSALTLIEYMRNGAIKKTVEANEALCQGCGVCQATCPKQGIMVRGFTHKQLSAVVDALFGTV